MKVTVLMQMGCRRSHDGEDASYLYKYVLQAENGIIETDEADVYLPLGFVLELPDDEWHPDSAIFHITCDKCGFKWDKKSIKGTKVPCPLCGTEELL